MLLCQKYNAPDRSCSISVPCPSCRLSISSLSRRVAYASPSPYISDKNTPNMPSKQYTLSSFNVVVRWAAQLIRSSTLNSARLCPLNTPIGTLMILCISCSNDILLPSLLPSSEKNSTHGGARSSCNVQPRVNHRLCRNASSCNGLSPRSHD
jgi:hypothetical protein